MTINRRPLRIALLSIFFAFFLSYSYGQEILTGLQQNSLLVKESMKEQCKESQEYPAVILPFFDDFSYNSLFPDPALWMDRKGFVNNTFPIYPPTIGVVTLDALDENGKIYSHASSVPFPADTLTSRPIRLDSIFSPERVLGIRDSIYFSFYYQPGGGTYSYPYLEWERIGDAPETGDKLVLEFGYATEDSIFSGYSYVDYELYLPYSPGDSIESPCTPGLYYVFTAYGEPNDIIQIPCDSLFAPRYVWNEVWSSNGSTLDEWLNEDTERLSYFKQVMIPILEEEYLRDNFQFRFRNYASLEDRGITGWEGNVDQWHIDYVFLYINRSSSDIYPNDVAIVAPTTTMLQKYHAMPWNQFRESDMKTQFNNQLSNLSSIEKNTSYYYSVYKNNTDFIGGPDPNNQNTPPYFNNGLSDYGLHATPTIDFSLQPDDADSALFTITHVFEVVGTADFSRRNDTFIYEQKFHNYYAYDDGTAEAGYSVYSSMTEPEASFAVHFKLNEPDSLRAVRMWFNHTLNDANLDYFTLKVWAVGEEGKPGEELYSKEAQLPVHAYNYLDFVNYYLDEPLYIENEFFVGFYQNHRTQLNIGFDQNSDARGEFFYKSSNIWYESYYKGAPMIRPVMGKFFDHSGVTQRQNELANVTVFPNPTHGIIYYRISGFEGAVSDIQVYDMYGRSVIIDHNNTLENAIDLSSVAPGIYFVKLISGSSILSTSKVIKL